MNKKSILISIIFIAICNLGFGQEYSFKNYDWKAPDLKVDIPAQFANENEIVLDKTMKVELVVENDRLYQFFLLHQRTYINSNDAIERNNKIYIPFNLNESVVLNKARVILKNGTVIELDKKDIKEEIDEEKQVKYNFFAVNGLEKGAIIEKIYLLQEKPDLKGNSFRMQAAFPILNHRFDLIYPNYLIFKTKSYNGLPTAILDDTTLKDKSILTVLDQNTAGLDDNQKYSNINVNRKLFRYKLSENTNSKAKNLNNFKEFGTSFYDNMNTALDSKSEKAVKAFSDNITKPDNLQDLIWNVENKIKKTIKYVQNLERANNISDVFKTKQANETDLIKTYMAIFKFLNIEYQTVFTSSREMLPFDKDFESYENLDKVLFYFPTLKMYLSPAREDYRIPYIPADLANNNGLFIKEKKFAGVSMGVSEVGFIEILGAEQTHDFMDIKIDFTKNMDNPEITTEIKFGGYAALNMQPIKDYVSPEEYNNILKSIATNYTNATENKSLTTENEGLDNIGKKPFVVKVVFEGKDLIQKAGENYLFSVGQTIGKQMELYQEGIRTLPVEIDYPHKYTRKIKILLPNGVTVKNLEKFKIDFKLQLSGKTEALWSSDYKQTNANEIIIENSEYYNVINYPLDVFEQYKAVINAAADFNKIVIILSK